MLFSERKNMEIAVTELGKVTICGYQLTNIKETKTYEFTNGKADKKINQIVGMGTFTIF